MLDVFIQHFFTSCIGN